MVEGSTENKTLVTDLLGLPKEDRERFRVWYVTLNEGIGELGLAGYSEKLEAAFSKLQVFNEAGQEVDNRNQRLDPGNAALLIVSLPPLRPGIYKVVWHVVSVDTHTTQGSFKFEVIP